MLTGAKADTIEAALGPEGYKVWLERRQHVHERLLQRARLPAAHAAYHPDYKRSKQYELNTRSKFYFREIEILHPVDKLGRWGERPTNLKHLSKEEQREFKHIDFERPPTPPPQTSEIDTIICRMRGIHPEPVLVPQKEETINLDPGIPCPPGAWVPEKRWPASRGAEKYFNYRGEWGKGAMSGKGVYTFALMGTYDGQWEKGRQNGIAKATYMNECVHEGMWKDGKMNGSGKITYSNGNVYEGHFKDGRRCGHGRLRLNNGAVYDGQFKDGLFHGRGVFKDQWGNKYDGMWLRGKIEGSGALYCDNERIVRTAWPRSTLIATVARVRREKRKAKEALVKRQLELTQLMRDVELEEWLMDIRERNREEIIEKRKAEENERRRALTAKKASQKERRMKAVLNAADK